MAKTKWFVLKTNYFDIHSQRSENFDSIFSQKHILYCITVHKSQFLPNLQNPHSYSIIHGLYFRLLATLTEKFLRETRDEISWPVEDPSWIIYPGISIFSIGSFDLYSYGIVPYLECVVQWHLVRSRIFLHY
jgi:hypothetical protein